MTQINPKVKIRLRRLGKVRWDVLAVMDAHGRTVQDSLKEVDPAHANHAGTLLALLRDSVPMNGPPLTNELRCKPLRDQIFEFKAGPRKRGIHLRVLWFYDENRRVICTHFFLKGSTTPQDAIDAAIDIRRAYQEQVKGEGVVVYPKEPLYG